MGQEKFTSPRRCFEDMTSYAPPYALRVITVSLGTVASAYAYSNFAPCRMIPPCSEANSQCKKATTKAMQHAHTLIGPGQKAWNVHKCHKRNVKSVAETNKTRALDGRVDVETASEGVRLVSNNANSSSL